MAPLLRILLLLCISGGAATAVTIEEHSLPASIEFVDRLDLDCTLTDGYVCADVEEDSFLMPDSWQKMVPAPYLRAWQIAYDDFRRIPGLTDAQKDLTHYKVGFTENESQYIVLLLGLALPYIDDNGNPNGIVNAVYGRSTKYWIDKKTNEIAKRLFYK